MKKHEKLVNLVCGICKESGMQVEINVEYEKGSLDVVARTPCGKIYYNIKSNWSPVNVVKARAQIKRAIEHNMCRTGYMVCSQGVYDVLHNGGKVKFK